MQSASERVTPRGADPTATAADSLQGAFELFLSASRALEAQQQQLQAQIGQLSADLAAANTRLREEIAEKQQVADRLSALLDALPTGVVLTENGKVIDFNPAAAGLAPALALAQDWQVPESWTATNGPGEYQTGSGADAKVLQVREIESDERAVVQLIDITDSIRMHGEREREAKLVAMGKMSADIAHQLRTPLSTALLYASHLCNEQLPAAERASFAQRLRSQLMSLEKLASNMLNFVRQRPKKLEVVPIAELVDEAIGTVAPICQGRGVKLEVHANHGTAMVTVERPRILGALLALLENALDVSEPGQAIRLTTQAGSPADGQRVRLIVEDQGPGIAPDMMSRLFEPFATGRVTGTGLGLSIARNAVEAHRGEITAGNRPEGGARFMLTLPSLTAL